LSVQALAGTRPGGARQPVPEDDELPSRQCEEPGLKNQAPVLGRLLKKSKSYDLWISARPAVAPYQQLPNALYKVGLDRRASRSLFSTTLRISPQAWQCGQ